MSPAPDQTALAGAESSSFASCPARRDHPHRQLAIRGTLRHAADAPQHFIDARRAHRQLLVALQKGVALARRRSDPTPQPIEPGSEAEFITEHYWGYTKRTRGATSEYGVQHPRWLVYAIRNFAIQADFGAL